MQKPLKFMLLGIFLAVLGIWCLLAGDGGMSVFAVAGWILPLAALVCFLTGFSSDGVPSEQKPPEDTDQTEKETEL